MHSITALANDVRIPTHESATEQGPMLEGTLIVPTNAVGLILFAHGAGSSRLSPRNATVAEALRATGELGTLLFDLLTPSEDVDYQRRFDIDLLTERLVVATKWLASQPPCSLRSTRGSALPRRAAMRATWWRPPASR
jgi:hypothetical protein